MDKHYFFTPGSDYCGNNPGNNGNIAQIQDMRNNNWSQGFSYDALNRLTAFSNGDGSMQQSYAIDSFGNMSQSGTLSSSSTFGTDNRINASGYGHDSAGNLTSFNNGISTTTYTYNANNQVINLNSGSATYTYDANGQRVRKDVGSSWTEYAYFNGQPLAEKNSDGTWSDYIYANGQKIARADSFDARLHMEGINCDSNVCGSRSSLGFIPVSAGYVIQNGDILQFRQFQSGSAQGGLMFTFTDGSNANWLVSDTDGQLINSDTYMDVWHLRTVDMSTFAGKAISTIGILNEVASGAGQFDLYFGEISIVETDGHVFSIYDRQTGSTLSTHIFGTPAQVSGFNAFEESSNQPGDSIQGLTTTTYYHGDQIGSARMLTSAGGWPVSSDTFYPFGQEQNPTTDPNHYKFTGKERDTESGLDYFGARYYASGMGRFMSPDFNSTGDDQEPVPYADFENPQSLNLYSYVANNPLSRKDVNGHSYLVYDGSANTLTLYSASGQVLGTYPANNNVDSASSLGKLPDGSYPMLDQNAPYMHGNAVDPSDPNLQDSENGEFGPGGIFRVQYFKGPDGKIHRGVGVHAGRKDKPDRRGRTGPAHATQGCIRTCDAAIRTITSTAKTDPLTSLEVMSNSPTDNSNVTTTQQDSKDGVPIKPCGGGNPCNQ